MMCPDSFWVAYYVTAAVSYAKHHHKTVGLTNEGTSDEFDDFYAKNSSMDELEKDTQTDEDIIMEEDNDILNSEDFVTDQVLSHVKEIPIDNTLLAEKHEDIVVINDNSEIEPTLDEFFSQTKPMILSLEEQHRLTTQSDEGVKFSEYFLALDRPWSTQTSNGGTLPGSTMWNDLCHYIHTLDHGGHNQQLLSFLDGIR